MRLLALAAVLLSLAAQAGDELSPKQLGTLRYEQQQAADAVAKRHGGKKPKEMSPEELRAYAEEKAAAERAVLEKHGVDPKGYARASVLMSREDRAAADAAAKQAKAKAAAAAKQGGGKKEIVIEKNGVPTADQGAAEAAELDRQRGLGPGKGGARGKHRRR